jgi:leucyl-tRNA synthetase
VLANEQVIDGRCERCGTEVEARKMEQWFFRITSYADDLLRDHALIDWPERTKAIQRNWIGRSEGAELLFRFDELDVDVPVFTTRADTVFGATFFVIAPEHPLVDRIAERSPHADEIRDYVRRSAAKRGEERATAEEKTGVFTGLYATNPATDESIPVWVADYVLME